MRFTRRQPSGRGRLSLRSRLLAGLITITALFPVSYTHLTLPTKA